MTEETKTQNPLLERARMPGSTFTLPSQGIFYNDGELDSSIKDGEIYIYPMVTIDEILFKTPDKLFSGEAITDVFKRCVPGVLKPLRLLASDMDFIMAILRKLTYGDIMEVTYTHDCSEDAKEHTYGISMSPFIVDSKRIDPSSVSTNFTTKLENGQVVHLIPPRFENVLKIYQSASDNDTNTDVLEKELIETITSMVSKVDEIEDRAMILEWAKVLKAGWIHQISNSVEKVSDWGPSFETTVVCKDCKNDIKITTPINPLAFFI